LTKSILLLFVSAVVVHAQTPLTPQQAVREMTRGINIGNSLDAYPGGETSWGNPPIAKSYLAALKKEGFNAVRIPITWGYDGRSLLEPPYTVDSTFMARVDTVVTWALDNGLIVVMNAHHEFWLKDTVAITAPADTAYADSAIARFDSIWSQIATHFQNKSDSLIFEILNEPYPSPQATVDKINAQVLKIIRRTNPTRIVSYSGYMWSNSAQLVIAQIPDSSDKYLIGYYHSYDPYPFGLDGGDTSNAVILSVIESEMSVADNWSQKNGIPIMLGEYGFMNGCAYNPRMYAYATIMDQSLQHNVAPFAWDDGGQFTIANRANGTFNEIAGIIVHTTPQSPTNLLASVVHGGIKLQWHNRNTESDSIFLQRGVGGAPQNGVSGVTFLDYLKLGPEDSVFVDSMVTPGSTYYYRLSVTMKDSTEIQSYPIMIEATADEVVERTAPTQFELFDNYPNPFNPTTLISYQLPENSKVTLKVYDVLGREVSTLVNEKQSTGLYKVKFDGANLASGVYFYRVNVSGSDGRNFSSTNKMILLK
jgi:endoglucanase